MASRSAASVASSEARAASRAEISVCLRSDSALAAESSRSSALLRSDMAVALDQAATAGMTAAIAMIRRITTVMMGPLE